MHLSSSGSWEMKTGKYKDLTNMKKAITKIIQLKTSKKFIHLTKTIDLY